MFTHWGLDFIISISVLTLISTITATGMFWLYGAFALVGFFYLRKHLPETKGRSLEDVDRQLQASADDGS